MKKIALGIAITFAAFVACTGDDPSASTGAGAQGQACFANGTCLVGLACVQKVCVVTAADADVPETSTPFVEAGTHAADAGPDGEAPLYQNDDCGQLGTADQLTCPVASTGDATCASGAICCPGAGCMFPPGECHATDTFGCFSNEECAAIPSGPPKCCLARDVLADNPSCQPLNVTKTGSATCRSSCADSEVELCNGQREVNGNTTCSKAGTTCIGAAIPLHGADGFDYLKAVGVCH